MHQFHLKQQGQLASFVWSESAVLPTRYSMKLWSHISRHPPQVLYSSQVHNFKAIIEERPSNHPPRKQGLSAGSSFYCVRFWHVFPSIVFIHCDWLCQRCFDTSFLIRLQRRVIFWQLGRSYAMNQWLCLINKHQDKYQNVMTWLLNLPSCFQHHATGQLN